jgi:hypothetical protein
MAAGRSAEAALRLSATTLKANWKRQGFFRPERQAAGDEPQSARHASTASA